MQSLKQQDYYRACTFTGIPGHMMFPDPSYGKTAWTPQSSPSNQGYHPNPLQSLGKSTLDSSNTPWRPQEKKRRVIENCESSEERGTRDLSCDIIDIWSRVPKTEFKVIRAFNRVGRLSLKQIESSKVGKINGRKCSSTGTDFKWWINTDFSISAF
ncbi:hypothetical protein LOTGIDRAFT_233612 [Lottia gigantea]|uniref:Uncharacterized protein n=1 Tax=Lottia gigantea TaxID=225164 RepID=V4AC52_LOTGI|nr:hypothetical protein LOTGIDRAFT_233612 [Lottia gigantea]ESO90856.1 hypothetical protein LOTGIDRAFT_233612 [Lottia gigantea]